jgi:HEAT repeat protein
MLRSLLLGAGLVGCLACAPALAAAEGYDDAAILAAARFADDLYRHHLGELTAQLRSPDSAARIAAIAFVARLDDPETVPLLLPFLRLGNDDDEQIAAIMALGHLHTLAAAPGMRELIASSKNPLVRTAAINALAQIQADQAGDYMPKVKDPEPAISGASLTNLGTLAHQPAADVLAWGMAHDRRQVYRRMCAIGLGRIGDRNQGPNLVDALGDADPGVRRYAAEAMVKLDYKPGIPYLLLALEGNAAGAYLNRCLIMLSGQDFGFDWRANERARREAVERGFKWWTDHAPELAN